MPCPFLHIGGMTPEILMQGTTISVEEVRSWIESSIAMSGAQCEQLVNDLNGIRLTRPIEADFPEEIRKLPRQLRQISKLIGEHAGRAAPHITAAWTEFPNLKSENLFRDLVNVKVVCDDFLENWEISRKVKSWGDDALFLATVLQNIDSSVRFYIDGVGKPSAAIYFIHTALKRCGAIAPGVSLRAVNDDTNRQLDALYLKLGYPCSQK